jgi:tRNA-specific 2-thiouridylase
MGKTKNNITVAVGMSGGVDSSVAALMLLKEGYRVIGITMKTYDYAEVGGYSKGETNCCDMQAVMDARAVADKLGFSHCVVNLREEFERNVIQNFIDEYLEGRTPNPCVICNREIKFGLLLNEARKYGADYIATGHYAKLHRDQQNGRFILSKGSYTEKDQSYALWAVTQESLGKTMFPLGGLTKPQVRDIAEENGLANAHKHESYEICFIPDDNYERFLAERLPDLSARVYGGNIIMNGNFVGTHDGYPFFTIGQRKNIGAYGQKMYVTAIDSKTNTIQIGPDEDLYHSTLIAGHVNWGKKASIEGYVPVQAKVRYKDESTDALVCMEDGEKIRVAFSKPKRAITTGQSVVVYEGEDILCGGIIEKVLN